MVAARWDVVGIGACSVDDVYRLDVFPKAGSPRSKVPVRSHSFGCGGQTATTMAACSAFGLMVKFVGAVGRDDRGELIQRTLNARGVDTSDLRVLDGATSSNVVLVDAAGDRLVLWNRNRHVALPPDSLPADAIRSSRAVHVDDVDVDLAIAAARLARSAGIPVTSDLDHVSARTRELLAHVTVPIFADHVPLELTGLADHEAALRALRQYHPGLLIVTLGERGALALDGDAIHHGPAFPTDPTDTTGAGDVFRAGVIHALLRGIGVPDLLRFANAVAAASCARTGAIDGVPSVADVERVLSGR